MLSYSIEIFGNFEVRRQMYERKIKRRRYRCPIPANAKLIVKERYEDGEKKWGYYYLKGTKVGYRYWCHLGNLQLEYGFKNGKKHGNELRFYDDGNLMCVEPYRHGKMHGVTKQWADDGRLLITYTLRKGVGMDLWCEDDGTLAENHYWPDEGEVGYMRFWNEDQKTIFMEDLYTRGEEFASIRRAWNHAGKLSRGFPQYFIGNKKVTKRQYLLACKTEVAMPPYRAKDDNPKRKLPEEYLAQRTAK